MKILALTFAFVSVITFDGVCQEHLIHYLAGDKYGLADESMKIRVPPIYDELLVDEKRKIILARKGEEHTVLNWAGESIVPTSAKPYGRGSAFYISGSDTSRAKVPDLICLSDHSAKKKYYFNTHLPVRMLNPYVFVEDVRQGRRSYMTHYDFPRHEMVKVATPDLKINFMDTAGTLIFSEGIYDGWVISKHCIAVDDGNGRLALYNRKALPLTRHIYNHVEASPDPRYATGRIVIDERENISEYDLIRNDGHYIATKLDEVIPLNDEYVILTDSASSGVFHYDGTEIFNWRSCRLSRIGYQKHEPLLVKGKAQYGIVNLKGDLLVDTMYQSIKYEKGLYFCKHAGGSVVLDEHFRAVISIEELEIAKAFPASDETHHRYYQVVKSTGYAKRHGIVDSTGNLVIPPVFSSVGYLPECHVLHGLNEHGVFVFDLQGDTLISDTLTEYRVVCGNDGILMTTDSIVRAYDRTGAFVKETRRQSIEEIRRAYGNHLPILKDKNGNAIPNSKYQDVFSNTDEKGKRTLWVGRTGSSADPWCSLFNETGKEITPEGYGLPENNAWSGTGINGGIVVFHRQDVLGRRYPFRCGVINFDGEWILPPRFQKIRIIGGELLVCHNPDLNINTLYNRYGDIISDKNYDYFENDVNDQILNDRIVVGYMTNREEYIAAYLSVYGSGDLVAGYQRRDELKEAKFLKGFINSLGEEVIPVQYLYAEPFRYVYTTVTGMDTSGTLYSSVIDVNGNPILQTDYERLEIEYYDTTLLSAVKNGKYGIIDLAGNVLIDPRFEAIRHSEIPGIFIANDSIASYVVKGDKVTKLKKATGMDIKSISEGYFYIKLTYQNSAGKYAHEFHVFDVNGRYYGDLSAHITNPYQTYISNAIEWSPLPEGYLAISSGSTSKRYVIRIDTMQAYRE